MKLVGLTRIRNEEVIIKDTLDHWSQFCNGGIYVYDDASTDKTVQICKSHSAVKQINRSKYWGSNRLEAEYMNRQSIFFSISRKLNDDDWLVYFDADERLFFTNWKILDLPEVDAIDCRLLDFYITPEDVNKRYDQREWVGPEYRDILFFFRKRVALGYFHPDQRECSLKKGSKKVLAGFVKHYGKALTIEKWEEKCEYYFRHFPMYSEKWDQRRGKAVHTVSDFGRPLIKFSDIVSGKKKSELVKVEI